MENDSPIRVFATAFGRVQGVGFRYFVQCGAQERSISGWARNMDDGTVQMQLQGKESDVRRLLGRIKEGNMWIRVDRLDVETIEASPDESGFKIIG